jgi:SAM-dependent methyltransferase
VSDTNNLYRYPKYFEVAYAFRDIPGEAGAIAAIIEQYSAIPVRRLLELGCGTAPHLEALADRGYHYVGLDRSPEMLAYARRKAGAYARRKAGAYARRKAGAYARRKAEALEPPATFHQGDLIDFELDAPVDFAMVLLGSLYVASTAELAAHFDAVARALRPGGLYLLDWCINMDGGVTFKDWWDHTEGEISVRVLYETRLVAPAQQVVEETVTLEVDDAGERHVLTQVARQRQIYPQELLIFIRQRPDFEFVGWWDNWRLDHPLDDQDSVYRPIVVLRRI